MLSSNQMLEIAQTENVIFYKPGCPFCAASEVLFKKLQELKIVGDFKIYQLNTDFDNDLILELVKKFDWQPESHQSYPSKPQIFINEAGKTEYIGGNFEFYKSRYNLGDKDGKIEVNGKTYEAANLTNPMKF
jgi:glutaredoxin